MIDILKHISIVVLQDMESEVKMEAKESDNIDIKHEQDLTYNHVRAVKIETKVKDSSAFMYIYIFTYGSITAFKSL